mgnify:CR=1 FL=1|tara:strand:+ start:396 stop:2102 length:1707 start_codon:yes stop_codon:yes gene_type:complete
MNPMDILLIICAIVLIALFNRSKKQARDIRDELQSILDSLEPIVLLNPQGKILRANQAYADSFDREFNDIIGKKPEDITRGANAEGPMIAVLDELKVADDHTIQRYKAEGSLGQLIYDVEKYKMLDYQGSQTELEIRHNVTRLYRIQEVLQRQKNQLENRTQELFDSNNQLESIRTKLEENLEEKDHEFNMARDIQQGLLPLSLPSFQAFNFWSFYKPYSNVGGDLYDIIPLGNQKFGFFIGDVSGHGLAAAFVGALAKMSLTVHSKQTPHPDLLFEMMNSDLNQVISSGYYLTAFYGVLDLFDNSFTYTRASHPHPIVLQVDGGMESLDSKGLFLGAFDDGRYEKSRVYLKPGDRLFFFTDGCYEMESKSGDHLGYKQIRETIEKYGHRNIDEIYGLIQSELFKKVKKDWTVQDDQTFLILEINKKPRIERLKYLLRFESADSIQRTKLKNYDEMTELLIKFAPILRSKYGNGIGDGIAESIKEAVINAIIHGHQEDFTKSVIIAYQFLENEVRVSITDKGSGFNIDELERPANSSETGYGILLIKTYMDETFYDNGVKTFSMIKYL